VGEILLVFYKIIKIMNTKWVVLVFTSVMIVSSGKEGRPVDISKLGRSLSLSEFYTHDDFQKKEFESEDEFNQNLRCRRTVSAPAALQIREEELDKKNSGNYYELRFKTIEQLNKQIKKGSKFPLSNDNQVNDVGDSDDEV